MLEALQNPLYEKAKRLLKQGKFVYMEDAYGEHRPYDSLGTIKFMFELAHGNSPEYEIVTVREATKQEVEEFWHTSRKTI